MKTGLNFPSALILITITVSAAACDSSGNRAVSDTTINNQPNAARNMNEANAAKVEVRIDLENLEKQINLPVRPLEAKWTAEVFDNSKGAVPGPTDYRLTALLKFDEKTAAELENALTAETTTKSLGKTDVKDWFPDEVKNQAATRDGKSSIEGAKYPPDRFLRAPYRNGSLVRVGNTNYFVLNVFSF